MSIISELQELRDQHELPNSNGTDYNRGYVAAMNKAIYALEKRYIQRLEDRYDQYGAKYRAILINEGKTAEYWLQLGRTSALSEIIDEVLNEPKPQNV